MYAKTIETIAQVNPKIADAIKIMITRGFNLNYAYQDPYGNWDINFKGNIEEEDISEFLFNTSKCVTCFTTIAEFPAIPDENYTYKQRDREDSTSIYLN